MKKYHFRIVLPLIIAIIIGMTGPLIALGLNRLITQITPVYVMLVTGIISISLFIIALYRVATFISNENISKQFLTPYLFLIGMTASGVVSFSIIFVVMNW
ncbi:MAG TPA: hypothetical protein VK094_06495 [Pseudogracilibacillus sp.]|nr:hypothetical protein [Pseudogracilibacillus sp.]